jgi:hypothetical protein
MEVGGDERRPIGLCVFQMQHTPVGVKRGGDGMVEEVYIRQQQMWKAKGRGTFTSYSGLLGGYCLLKINARVMGKHKMGEHQGETRQPV